MLSMNYSVRYLLRAIDKYACMMHTNAYENDIKY